jgi:hypothetical protein
MYVGLRNRPRITLAKRPPVLATITLLMVVR